MTKETTQEKEEEDDERGSLLSSSSPSSSPSPSSLPSQNNNYHNEGSNFITSQWTCIMIICLLGFTGILIKHFEDAKERERQFLIQLLKEKEYQVDSLKRGEGGGGEEAEEGLVVVANEEEEEEEVAMEKEKTGSTTTTITTTSTVKDYHHPEQAKLPYDPFHLLSSSSSSVTEQQDWYGSYFVAPPYPSLFSSSQQQEQEEEDLNFGYLHSPTISNNTIVFITEGDLYLSHLSSFIIDNDKTTTTTTTTFLPAMKLTSTIGNVQTPKLNPIYPHLLAFTATYTGRREVYLLNLLHTKRNTPAIRLTYTDSDYGVQYVVGWDDDGDGTSLVVCTLNLEEGLNDWRLYKIRIALEGENESGGTTTNRRRNNGVYHRLGISATTATTTSMEPIPLSQAIDGFYHHHYNTNNNSPQQQQRQNNTITCFYFTRTKQSSSTIRYRGGTTENLWMYCDDDDDDDDDNHQKKAIPITGDYVGTSKSPSLWRKKNGEEFFLLFLSDRFLVEEEEKEEEEKEKWGVGTMELWAMPLPSYQNYLDYLSSDNNDDDDGNDFQEYFTTPTQITSVYCQNNNNLPLSEYTIDASSSKDKRRSGGKNNVVLRIGADLHLLDGEVVSALLNDAFFGQGDGDDDDNGGSSGTTGDVGNNKTRNNKRKTKRELKKKNKHHDKNYTNVVNHPTTTTTTTRQSPPSSSSSLQTPPPKKLPIVIYSDFNNMHERTIPITLPHDINTIDVYSTSHGSTDVLLNLRGQVYVAPTITSNTKKQQQKKEKKYTGDGMNVPPRRYKIAPGSTTGGILRILSVRHIPSSKQINKKKRKKWALVLATDPKSPHAEHGLYILRTDVDAMTSFVNAKDLPDPIWGGHLHGGSTKEEGGLGSINADSLTVSPCGRRVAWTDTDGRIVVVSLPLSIHDDDDDDDDEITTRNNITVLPQENENNEPMIGKDAELSWSPFGRYLAIVHKAKNQFSIISIADLGDPNNYDDVDDYKTNVTDDDDDTNASTSTNTTINVGRIVQATPSRFNSMDATWGFTGLDLKVSQFKKTIQASIPSSSSPSSSDATTNKATTLYFLSDRDIVLSSDTTSPWGTRAPSPHFPKQKNMYALPLQSWEKAVEDDPFKGLYPGLYSGGGAAELMGDSELKVEELIAKMGGANEKSNGDGGGKEEVKDDDHDDDDNDGVEDENGPQRKRRLWDDDDDDDDDVDVIDVDNIAIETRTKPSAVPNTVKTSSPTSSPSPTTALPSSASLYPSDIDIDFGPRQDHSLSFARRAYQLSHIPKANYIGILCQLSDDPSLILVEVGAADGIPALVVFAAESYPGDGYDAQVISVDGKNLEAMGLSTSGDFIYVVYGGMMKVIPNTAEGVVGILMKDSEYNKNIVDTDNIGLSVWPTLEYHQMYSDAWRMMRDYFYDPDMTNIPWNDMYDRYLPLVKRCAKREELDDVLRLMASEVSALHVFVKGGEYSSPLHGSIEMDTLSEVGSLGASLRRSSEWNGYVVMSVPERDPDFGLLDGEPMYSPLSDRTLQMSGQRGLKPGDVIVGVNGEGVMAVPDIHMLLRGTAGRSVRLEVLRISSGSVRLSRDFKNTDKAMDVEEVAAGRENDVIAPEPVIVVPITGKEADKLRYASWEWKTREAAKSLAREAGFTVGYIHLQSMSGAKSEDAFVRGFYPDYDKQALIIDVRHNSGGNIDSWLLDVLQRRAWMYWQGRATNITNGGYGWDEQFAFRGHIVVLINERTSSDGEGFARGCSELGLGKLVGTRSWGGGIWLSSDNTLVDGGIATAPELGQYNKNFGWGLGIEMVGITPDVIVDNNPREAYDGKDQQLEEAIKILGNWLKEEPVVLPKAPGPHRDNSFDSRMKCQTRG